MKAVARRPTRRSECTGPKVPVLPPTGPPPPPGYSHYPPPYAVYYYHYPYPHPPPYHYAPVPPLQPPPPSCSNSKNTAASAEPTKQTTTTSKSQPPRLVSSSSSSSSSSSATPDARPSEDDKASAGETEETLQPHENDVLMGRGGKNNTHIGNEKLRDMARAMREVYIKSRKKDKTNMARQLVQQVFSLNPPGRFLQRDPVTMVWEAVDLDTARHKTSQCLRDAASEKPSYTKIQPEEDTPMEIVESGTQTVNRPTTPEPTTVRTSEDPINRALTPILSNRAHKIEASPQPIIEASSGHVGSRNRIESWESGSITRILVESWDDNNGSFQPTKHSRRESLDVSNGSRQRMYTWMPPGSDHYNVDDLDMEDAVLIPPEELDAAEGDEPFSLLDVSQLDEEEMQLWQPEMDEELENPFDTEFFY